MNILNDEFIAVLKEQIKKTLLAVEYQNEDGDVEFVFGMGDNIEADELADQCVTDILAAIK